MHTVVLIMAGGKGTRFGKGVEKPMVKLFGKTLIRRVIEASKASKKISETYVAVTPDYSQTADEAKKASAKVIETKGDGFHADLRQAVLKLNLRYPVLTVSSDLPLLTGGFLDEIINEYEKLREPALTVLVPINLCKKYGVEPTSFYDHRGKTYAVSGINIIDGRRILEEQPQKVMICRRPEAIFNVNTQEDLKSAEKYMLQIGKS